VLGHWPISGAHRLRNATKEPAHWPGFHRIMQWLVVSLTFAKNLANPVPATFSEHNGAVAAVLCKHL
jgi:hypothetical protein